MDDIFKIIIGTAGHIDHGKSSLIRYLTGIDPDRLKEEKERGLTIDLGFAPLHLPDGRKLGIIDVPGHEKFIKNMVAGATSIDFVILVIAADDGVMPQTREHLEIMQMLGLEKGIVVITKIDKVEEDLAELAVEEAREFVAGTFLEQAPVLPVSAITGQGMEQFSQTLFQEISTITAHSEDGVFRMPIQRIFSRHGHGTVITGVPISGKAVVGDILEILPGGWTGKIKKIQAYGQEVATARAGQSSALNVKDLDYKKIQRGQVAATPHYYSYHHFFEGKFRYLTSSKKPLKNLTMVRFHCGTLEEMGKLVILGREKLLPGESCYVQIRLESPASAAVGDNFIVRLSSPTITIGGGVIIGMGEKKLKRFRQKILEQLGQKEQTLASNEDRIELELKIAGYTLLKEKQLLKISQLPQQQLQEIMDALLEQQKVIKVPGHYPKYVHREVLQELIMRMTGILEQFFQENPHKRYMEIFSFQHNLQIDTELSSVALQHAQDNNIFIIKNNLITLPKRKPHLTQSQKKTLAILEKSFQDQLFTPPKLEEWLKSTQKTEKQIIPVIEYLKEKEQIIEVSPGLFFHSQAIEQAKNKIVEIIKERGELIAADFRDHLQTTRKFIIPLLEYFDQVGLTVRRDNSRFLKEHS